MRRLGLVALGALSVGAAEPAPEAALPKLAGAPLTADDIWRAWPAAARSVGLEASVDVRCVVTVAGDAENCSAGSDAKNMGFEAAAIKLVQATKYTPGVVAGEPVPIAAPFTIDFRCNGRCMPFGGKSESSRSLILFPNWVAVPSPAEIDAAYPKVAAAAGAEGDATLLCRRTATGALDDCHVTEEAPANQGFGAAALSLAPIFRGPAASAGAKTEIAVRVPVRFRRNGKSSAQALVEGESRPLVSPRPPAPLKPATPKRRYYPKAAAKRELQGQVLMVCRVQADHSVKDCAVAQETPAGADFGLAAKMMSELYRVADRIVDDKEFRDDYVVIPTVFRIGM